MELKERIIECINDMTATELMNLYNEYQSITGEGVPIYRMSNMANILCYRDLFDDVKESFRRCKFNPSATYFVVIDHVVTSYYYLHDIDFIDVDIIADFIVDNRNDLGNCFVEAILDEYGS